MLKKKKATNGASPVALQAMLRSGAGKMSDPRLRRLRTRASV